MTTPALVASLAGDLGVFLAAVGLLALVLLRPSLVDSSLGGRSAIAAGATLLATAAVLHGTNVEADYSLHGLLALRLIAIGLVAIGALGLHEPRVRLAFLAALIVYGAGEIMVGSGSDTAGHVVRSVGAVAIGLAILRAARRSLAARIASAAGILLVVVVLAVSSSLSVVLTHNVDRDARDKARVRAHTEAGVLELEGPRAANQAASLARLLSGFPQLLEAFQARDEATRNAQLEGLRTTYGQVHFILLVTPQRQVVAATPLSSDGKSGLSEQEKLALAGSSTVAAALAAAQPTAVGALQGVDHALLAVGAAPIVVKDKRGAPSLAGAFVAGFRLDSRTLELRKAQDPGVDLTIDVSGFVAASTMKIPPARASGVLDGNAAAGVVTGADQRDLEPVGQGRFQGKRYFVAAAPIHDRAKGIGIGAAMVVSDLATEATANRTSLFKTLFLVALGAGLAALALALVLAERLARPLGRLTLAAEAIRAGDLAVRSQVRSTDEIGALGTTFDEMAGSVQRMTGELADAAAQRAAILASMSDGLVAADARGHVTMMNPAAEELLGVTEREAFGSRVTDIIAGHDRTGADLAARLDPPADVAFSANGFLTDRELPVALSGSPIRDESGQRSGAVYLLRDMRREFEVERMKTEFLSNISHELRTPLTPIKGYAEMLRLRRVPAGRARVFLDGILDASERLERIIDILVNFAALEAGRFVLRTETLDVREVLHQLSERWQSRSPHHDVEEKVSARIPRVVADRRLLERSIDELIDNAVKYSPDGGRVVLRARAATNGAGRTLQISVADEGLGIEPGDVDRIFDEFRQLDGSATRRFGGLGLGLPFVLRVVEAHQGHVDVASQPGRGSVFTLTLPLDGPTRGPAPEGSEQEDSDQPEAGGE